MYGGGENWGQEGRGERGEGRGEGRGERGEVRGERRERRGRKRGCPLTTTDAP